MTKEDIKAEMQKVTEGVVDVIVYLTASDKSRNKGFSFVEYESHRSAAMARQKVRKNHIQLWGHHVRVDWAVPELEVDEEIMAQVGAWVVMTEIAYMYIVDLRTTIQMQGIDFV